MAGSSQSRSSNLKTKVCLVGDNAVGKTSVVRRFVMDQFDDKYIATLGAKVSKKEIRLENADANGALVVDLTIWDIMGQPSFRELLREAYFGEAQGILAVTDVTRRETLCSLPEWIDAVRRTVGSVPLVVAANKTDLIDRAQFSSKEAEALTGIAPDDVFFTSAKTGTGIDPMFRRLASRVAEVQLRRSRP